MQVKHTTTITITSTKSCVALCIYFSFSLSPSPPSPRLAPAEDPVDADSDDSKDQFSFEFPLEESCNTAPGVLALKLCNYGTRGMSVPEFREVYCCNYSETCANNTVEHATEDEILYLEICGAYALSVSNVLVFASVVLSLLFAAGP